MNGMTRLASRMASSPYVMQQEILVSAATPGRR
jgi:hypothetical protein